MCDILARNPQNLVRGAFGPDVPDCQYGKYEQLFMYCLNPYRQRYQRSREADTPNQKRTDDTVGVLKPVVEVH